MAGLIDSVDQRTNLAGQNRMELLLFHLNGPQIFGINVFKVREVIRTPRLIQMPHSHPAVAGVAHIRDRSIAVLDMSRAAAGALVETMEGTSVIITEYNRSVQGFLVRDVDRIVNVNWKDILPPPSGASSTAYLTGVTRVDDRLVQIVDVEKIMDEINRAGGIHVEAFDEGHDGDARAAAGWHVLVVDDSAVARRQIHDTLTGLGVQVTVAKNGSEGLETLRTWAADRAKSPFDSLLMVVSDVEMPLMDGYTFATEIRKDDTLKGIYILMHSSLSGFFNNELAQQVGADDFLAKFAAEELGNRVAERLRDVTE